MERDRRTANSYGRTGNFAAKNITVQEQQINQNDETRVYVEDININVYSGHIIPTLSVHPTLSTKDRCGVSWKDFTAIQNLAGGHGQRTRIHVQGVDLWTLQQNLRNDGIRSLLCFFFFLLLFSSSFLLLSLCVCLSFSFGTEDRKNTFRKKSPERTSRNGKWE